MITYPEEVALAWKGEADVNWEALKEARRRIKLLEADLEQARYELSKLKPDGD